MGISTVCLLQGHARLWSAAAAIITIPLLMLSPHALGGENGPTPYDWDTFDWTELTSARATYICLADEPAAWCFEWWESRTIKVVKRVPEVVSEDPAPAHAPVVKQKAVPDNRWNALLKRIASGPPSPPDLRMLTLRADEDKDPAAMEVLGYAYAQGWGVTQDYTRAYEYYGRAFSLGSSDVKSNLDQLWKHLEPEEQQRLKGMFKAPRRRRVSF